MSTGYENTNQRFAKLAQMNEVVFHSGDLANLWQIENKNTLYTTLKRYHQQGLLFRIHKGLYSLKPTKDINAKILGLKALHKFSYISTETILIEKGIIQQNIPSLTIVSSQSKQFKIGKNYYKVRKLADRYLFNPAGVKVDCDDIRIATTERAIADLLYFNPDYYFDAQNIINWKKVKKIQKEVGYKK